MMSINKALIYGQQQLQERHITTARLDARLLLSHVLSRPLEYLVIHNQQLLSSIEYSHFINVLQRRLTHEPLSHIVGSREFWGLNFNVNIHVLDPRADSETLVQAVLNHITNRQSPVHIADLGTGSGCLLLSLLYELPCAHGVGIDISADALKTASQNAQRLGLHERADFKHQDWSLGLSNERYDWVISNPPYIPTAEIATLQPEVSLYEPWQALDGGYDGLEAYRSLAHTIKLHLNKYGRIALEVGYNQTDDVERIFVDAGYQCIEWVRDLSNRARCGIFKVS